jgi:prepilin-type processing-associated H-X9-DG protein
MLELMVVITIISILAALLLAGVGTAMSLANMLECQNNLSQIAKAVITYTADHKGAIPPLKYIGSNRYWCNILADKYLDAPDTSKVGSGVPSPRKSVLRCPLATDLFVNEGDSVDKPATDAGPDKAQGTARLGNPGVATVDCSYYWNGYSGADAEKLKRFPSVPYNPNLAPDKRAAQIHDISEIRLRTSTVMVADGVLFDADSMANRGRIAARHPGANGPRSSTNIAFYDGHVEAMSRIPGPNNLFLTDSLMSLPDLDTKASPMFMLPKR